MDERSLLIDVKAEIKDYQDFNKQIFYKTNKRFIIIAIACIIYLPIPILNIIIGNKEMPISIFFIVLLIPLITFVGAPIGTKYQLKKAMGKNEFMKKVQTYKISDKNISISSDSGETIVDWKELYRIWELKSSFAIYLSRLQVFVIPKRAFKDENQITVLRDIIQSNLPSEKLNKK